MAYDVIKIYSNDDRVCVDFVRDVRLGRMSFPTRQKKHKLSLLQLTILGLTIHATLVQYLHYNYTHMHILSSHCSEKAIQWHSK